MEEPLQPSGLPPPLFALGTVVVTPAARSALECSGQSEHEFLARHERGDWGDIDPEVEGEVNYFEAAPEGRDQLRGYVLSAYKTRLDDPLWVATVWTTETTTVSIPFDEALAFPDDIPQA